MDLNFTLMPSPREPLSAMAPPPGEVSLSEAQTQALAAATGPKPVVFITGRAGTGKSTIISYLRDLKDVVVCAPTGIAALNCRGTTLHSMFRIPSKFLDPDRPAVKPISGLSRIGTLVIDEVSMVRADVLDHINATLQYNRNSDKPFGGVKVVFVGDCRQLPPVVTENEREAMQARYKSGWWFEARCLQSVKLSVVQLTHIHRQTDPELIELLDCVRHGNIDPERLSRLNAQCHRGYAVPENALMLTARRRDAENTNQIKLDAIAGPSRVYTATMKGAFAEETESNVPAPRQLELKVGARVLVTRNFGTVVNGTLGVVTKLLDRAVQIRADGASADETLPEATWEKHRYVLNDGHFEPEVIGTYKQIPLTHGWAITIHKSQGLTLDSVCVDLGSGAFASGQTYVALSRTRSVEALTARRPFNRRDFITDPRVTAFHDHYGLL